MEKVLAQLDAFAGLAASSRTRSSRSGSPRSWTTIERARWRRAMEEQVTSVGHPRPFARYRDGVAAEVLPVSRPPEQSGVCWLPDGEEIYAGPCSATRRSTSTRARSTTSVSTRSPPSRTSTASSGRQVLGTDDVPAIYDRLRNDPALRFSTADEVHRAAEGALARAREAIPAVVRHAAGGAVRRATDPRCRCRGDHHRLLLPPVRRRARGRGSTSSTPREPTTRTRFESEALAFHESVPGHHLQLAIAQELEGVPAFRRHGHVTVYVEGWGLYTERLADEMGLYSGDLERLGILSFDSWRAGRLVVDTGLHAMGWSRQQAIDYLAANSPQARNNIVNEVDRYIGYTGQALAYKIGQREIFRLRAEAKATHGRTLRHQGLPRHRPGIRPGAARGARRPGTRVGGGLITHRPPSPWEEDLFSRRWLPTVTDTSCPPHRGHRARSSTVVPGAVSRTRSANCSIDVDRGAVVGDHPITGFDPGVVGG